MCTGGRTYCHSITFHGAFAKQCALMVVLSTTRPQFGAQARAAVQQCAPVVILVIVVPHFKQRALPVRIPAKSQTFPSIPWRTGVICRTLCIFWRSVSISWRKSHVQREEARSRDPLRESKELSASRSPDSKVGNGQYDSRP